MKTFVKIKSSSNYPHQSLCYGFKVINISRWFFLESYRSGLEFFFPISFANYVILEFYWVIQGAKLRSDSV